MRTLPLRSPLAAITVAVVVAASACGDRVSIGELTALPSPADGSVGSGDVGSSLDAGGAMDGSLDAHVDDAGPADAATYVPCANKGCGDACSTCRPSDPQCFETAVPKQCDSAGICRATVPICEAVDGGKAYEPCAGKTCGDSCKLCSPFDPGCFEPAVVKQCNVAGKCSASPVKC